jgi:hypothetical protein
VILFAMFTLKPMTNVMITKDGFYVEPEHVFDQFRKYHMKIC